MSAPAQTDRNTTLLAGLRRMPRRYLALAALVPVLIVLWLPILTGSRRSTGAGSPAAVNAPPAAPAGETAATPTSVGAITNAAALRDRLQGLLAPYTPKWTPVADKSPFRAPIVVATEALTAADAGITPTTILLGVGTTPVAIIGGQPYRPGDTIDGRSILAIEERRVLFREGNKTYAVSLPEPTLRGDHD